MGVTGQVHKRAPKTIELTSGTLQLIRQGCSEGQGLHIWKEYSQEEGAALNLHGPSPALKLRSKQNIPLGEVIVLSLSKQLRMEQKARISSAYGQEKLGIVQSPDQALLGVLSPG